jgi:hypothetical protein
MSLSSLTHVSRVKCDYGSKGVTERCGRCIKVAISCECELRSARSRCSRTVAGLLLTTGWQVLGISDTNVAVRYLSTCDLSCAAWLGQGQPEFSQLYPQIERYQSTE